MFQNNVFLHAAISSKIQACVFKNKEVYNCSHLQMFNCLMWIFLDRYSSAWASVRWPFKSWRKKATHTLCIFLKISHGLQDHNVIKKSGPCCKLQTHQNIEKYNSCYWLHFLAHKRVLIFFEWSQIGCF